MTLWGWVFLMSEELRLVGVYVHDTPVIAIPSQSALQRVQRRSTPRAHPLAHAAAAPSSLPIILAPILAPAPPFRVRGAEQRGLLWVSLKWRGGQN